ncbi:MAG: hypothetical protein ACRYHQ_07615 [Janthinobacterium lividum]
MTTQASTVARLAGQGAPLRTILQVMDDPNLLAPHFKGDTWGAWRAFFAALFGLPMDDDTLARYRHHTGRTVAPSVPFKEAALICGRRGGKSRALALIATYLATVPDYRPYLAPGEVATVAVIAADRRQARSIFRFIVGAMQGTELLRPLIAREANDALELTNGVVIEIHTASFRVTRGYSLAAALCDEVAFWRSDETSANPDEEILSALRPGLSNIPTSVLLIASSPYAKRGALYKAWRQNHGRDDARMLVWRGTTAEMNPVIDPAIIAQAYEDDPASAAAEYGAEFRNDIAAFVSREVVDGVTPLDRRELPFMAGVTYLAFVDPSGGSADSMTLAVAHKEGDRGILDAIREVRPPFSPEGTVAEFCDLLKQYGIREVTGDRYAGEWPREQFRKYGVTYNLSDRPKSDIYREVLPLLNSGKVALLDLPRLTSQLCGLERRTARGGRDSIDHAPGAHDDLANAAAGALVLVAGRRGGAELWAKLGEGAAPNLSPWGRDASARFHQRFTQG